MKQFLVLFFVLAVFLIYGCGNEKNVEENIESSEKITAQMYKIEEIEVAEEDIVEEEIYTVRLCHDTDNGILKFENGTVFGFYNDATKFEFNDDCQDNNLLWEFYCEDENPMRITFICKSGCRDNHCI